MGLGPGRGSLSAAGSAASRDWERGWSKNVSYSSVFLPGPAPPLPPNKQFPIAQLADWPPACPSPGLQDPDPPSRCSQTRGQPLPQPPPAPGSQPAPAPQLRASHIGLPEGAGLGLPPGGGGSLGVRPKAVGTGATTGATIWHGGRGVVGAPPAAGSRQGVTWNPELGRCHQGKGKRGGFWGGKLPVPTHLRPRS